MINTKPLIQAMETAPAVSDWARSVNDTLTQFGAKRLPDGATIKKHHLILALAVDPSVRMKVLSKDAKAMEGFDACVALVKDLFDQDAFPTKVEAALRSNLGS